MLHAAGIPVRQHYVKINTEIMASFKSPGTDYVDHSYTEVYLSGRWIKLDSYVIELTLFEAVKSRLKVENKLLGYGVHFNGSVFLGRDGE